MVFELCSGSSAVRPLNVYERNSDLHQTTIQLLFNNQSLFFYFICFFFLFLLWHMIFVSIKRNVNRNMALYLFWLLLHLCFYKTHNSFFYHYLLLQHMNSSYGSYRSWRTVLLTTNLIKALVTPRWHRSFCLCMYAYINV